MPATVQTREEFKRSDGYSEADVKGEAELRIFAQAITSKVETVDDGWILVTVWNVVGQQ